MMHCIAHKFLGFFPIYISFEAICIRQRKYFYTREKNRLEFSYVILWFIFIQFIAYNHLINFSEKTFYFLLQIVKSQEIFYHEIPTKVWIFNKQKESRKNFFFIKTQFQRIKLNETILIVKYVVAIVQVNVECSVIKYFIDASHSEKWNLFVLHYFF